MCPHNSTGRLDTGCKYPMAEREPQRTPGCSHNRTAGPPPTSPYRCWRGSSCTRWPPAASSRYPTRRQCTPRWRLRPCLAGTNRGGMPDRSQRTPRPASWSRCPRSRRRTYPPGWRRACWSRCRPRRGSTRWPGRPQLRQSTSRPGNSGRSQRTFRLKPWSTCQPHRVSTRWTGRPQACWSGCRPRRGGTPRPGRPQLRQSRTRLGTAGRCWRL